MTTTDMTIQTLKQNESHAEPGGAGELLKGTGSMGSRRTSSRLIGALFLAGFLVYGVGGVLVTSVAGAPDFLSTISSHKTILASEPF